MAKSFWLLKCEPAAYSIEDLERDGSSAWEGVRNYQARNFMRAMKKGDRALFYASNADPSGAAGVAEIVREAFPDPFQFRKGHEYYDSKSDPKDPIWSSVEIRFVERFKRVVPLAEMRSTSGLEGMEILKKGSRLSITPVTKEEFSIVTKLGRSSSGRSE